MRVYELVFILQPSVPDEEADQIIGQIETVVTEGGGTINKVDRWGKRRLAYLVKHHREGYYVLVQYQTPAGTGLAKEIERRLRVADPVIKFLTIRIDEELKRQEKRKQQRAARAARKPGAQGAPAEPKSRPKPEQAAPGEPEEEKEEAE